MPSAERRGGICEQMERSAGDRPNESEQHEWQMKLSDADVRVTLRSPGDSGRTAGKLGSCGATGLSGGNPEITAIKLGNRRAAVTRTPADGRWGKMAGDATDKRWLYKSAISVVSCLSRRRGWHSGPGKYGTAETVLLEGKLAPITRQVGCLIRSCFKNALPSECANKVTARIAAITLL